MAYPWANGFQLTICLDGGDVKNASLEGLVVIA
jgi:hypothetical protein